MGFIADIFGGKDDPAPAPVAPVEAPEPEPVEPASAIDPNRDKELAGAVSQRKEMMARRGRSKLVTSRAKARSEDDDSGRVIRAGVVVR